MQTQQRVKHTSQVLDARLTGARRDRLGIAQHRGGRLKMSCTSTAWRLMGTKAGAPGEMVGTMSALFTMLVT